MAPRGCSRYGYGPSSATLVPLVNWFPTIAPGSTKGTDLETDDLDAEVGHLRGLGVAVGVRSKTRLGDVYGLRRPGRHWARAPTDRPGGARPRRLEPGPGRTCQDGGASRWGGWSRPRWYSLGRGALRRDGTGRSGSIGVSRVDQAVRIVVPKDGSRHEITTVVRTTPDRSGVLRRTEIAGTVPVLTSWHG